MFRIEKSYEWSSAHILPWHDKCGRMHGHNYKMDVALFSDTLDEEKFWVMDFGDLDKIVKPLVNELDHRFILTKQQELDDFTDKVAWVYLDIDASTAECLAEYFAMMIEKELPEGIMIYRVTLWETPKSRASWG